MQSIGEQGIEVSAFLKSPVPFFTKSGRASATVERRMATLHHAAPRRGRVPT